MRSLQRATERIEQPNALDKVGGPANQAVHTVIKAGPLKDALSGTWLGHPLHPVLVAVPIGAWVGASVLDFGSRSHGLAARRLVGLGIIAAVPAALAGVTDWSDTAGAEQRVGTFHAAFNAAALALYGGSWLARRRSRRGTGKVLALAGGTALGVAGYLGGHLSYALGVGVNANAFQAGPKNWEPVGSVDDLGDGEAHEVSAGGASTMVVKRNDDWFAIANRCGHRGGPLSQGRVVGSCVVCPWHGSQFELETGTVRRGPAAYPQPVSEVEVLGGQVRLRRHEVRALRRNSVAAK